MNGQNGKNSWYLAYAVYGVAGVQVAVSVLAGLFFGNYVDKKIGTSPWLTIICLILGATGGFYNLVRIMNWHRDRGDISK